MGNIKWKKKYINKKLINVLYTSKILKKKKFNLKIFSKSMKIISFFKKINFNIYKGNTYRSFRFNRYCVNYNFGQFCVTRKPFLFTKKQKKKKSFIKR